MSTSCSTWRRATSGSAAPRSTSIRAGCAGSAASSRFTTSLVASTEGRSVPDVTAGTHALPTLAHVALASLGVAIGDEPSPELAAVVELGRRVGEQPRARLLAELARLLTVPHGDDLRLVRLARTLSRSHVELLALALALAVERDVVIGRALSVLQHPLGGSRPTVGLLARALEWSVKPGVDP